MSISSDNELETIETKVLIIGSGPSGYTAAIYAARACLDPVLVCGPQKGGQLTITTDVENYPGFAHPIQGPWLMDQMHDQAKSVGTKIIDSLIESVDFSRRPFVCYGDGKKRRYVAQTIIISTGAEARWLGLKSEEEYRGFGVSGCATCDGFFYRGKKVMVIGGGNTAVEEALYLTNHAKEVLLVHRRGHLRAEKVLQNRFEANEKIKPIWNSALVEVIGQENPKFVTGARLKNVVTGKEEEVDLDGIFIAIGHKPNTSIFRHNDDGGNKGERGANAATTIAMDEEGYILTKPGTTQTNVAGVFAAGDVQDRIYRQAVTAAGTGCMAAIEAEKFLSEHHNKISP